MLGVKKKKPRIELTDSICDKLDNFENEDSNMVYAPKSKFGSVDLIDLVGEETYYSDKESNEVIKRSKGYSDVLLGFVVVVCLVLFIVGIVIYMT